MAVKTANRKKYRVRLATIKSGVEVRTKYAKDSVLPDMIEAFRGIEFTVVKTVPEWYKDTSDMAWNWHESWLVFVKK